MYHNIQLYNHPSLLFCLKFYRRLLVTYSIVLPGDGTPVVTSHRERKHRICNCAKFRCPLASRKNGCSCENPCSESKYGRTVHLAMKDNPKTIISHFFKHSDSYVYFLYSFLRSWIIFTFQSAVPEFSWHDQLGFRESIILIVAL